MIFRGGGEKGGMISIIPKEGRKGRYRQVRLPYNLSIVSITPSKEVSLESIFQVALLSHIFRPRRRGANPSSQYNKFQLAAILNHPKLGPTYLYLLTSL